MKLFPTLALLTLTGCMSKSPAPIGQTEGAVKASGALKAEAVQAAHGMVASDNAIATDVGVRVLQSGGNAVDAAVATAFALAVAYPEAGNLGGGGFLVARLADGKSIALDFREKAPLGASHDMFLDAQGNVTNKSLIGHLASGVPGSVAGLYAAHQRYGSKQWKELLAPAIELATKGFTVDQHFSETVAAHEERLKQFTGSTALFLPGGKPLQTGTQWKNPELAAVLQRIADKGPPGFYEGETAKLIVAEMQRGGGLITLDDLKRYQPKWRDPVEFEYRGHRIISMPPASSGGLTLALMANIVEGYDLHSLGFHAPKELHLVAEASRRAFADRNYFLGDVDFVKVPRDRFLSKEYAKRQRATINEAHATPSAEIRPGLGQVAESNQTTHFSVVDGKGNAVALTTTLNELFGSAVTVTGAGFLLNDEMDDFSAKPGSPNMFGLVQGEQNAIAPEKRMLSAMTPTVVLDTNGQPMLITGARGGPRIISAVFQIISNVIDFNLPLAEAVGAGRIHHQHLPDILYFEQGGLTDDIVHKLQAMGHTVQSRDGYIGSAPTLLRVGDHWEGTGDPRTGGRAAGY